MKITNYVCQLESENQKKIMERERENTKISSTYPLQDSPETLHLGGVSVSE